MIKALSTSVIEPEDMERLTKYLDVEIGGIAVSGIFEDIMGEEAMIKKLEMKEILIISYDRVTKKVLQASENLKFIISERDGPEENIDIEASTELGIPVFHSVGRCERAVPEHTMAMLLALNRNIVWADQFIRAKKWTKENYNAGYNKQCVMGELFGKTIGIVGLGRNGIGIATRAQGFSMRVVGYDPYVDQNRLEKMGIESVELMTLMKESDYVVVMARVTPQSMGMIGKEEIAAMKPSASLINTARAKLVDTDALVEALREGKIRSAALDVFDEEPLPLDHPLFSIDPGRLLFSPHIAGMSYERTIYPSCFMTNSVIAFLNGNIPEGIVNPGVFDTENYKNRGALLFGLLNN